MQRKTGSLRLQSAHEATAENMATMAGSTPAASTTTTTNAAKELAVWLAKYEPVEQAVIAAHERRVANRARRSGKTTRAFGDLCEATEGFATVWRREGWSVSDMVRWANGDVFTVIVLAKWLRRDATRFIDRAQSRLRRPLYYVQEKARRETLARERRRVGGRRTINSCPTREEILDAWIHRRESHDAAVRFGSMVHDLECYVDNSLLRDESGAIVGRRGGVKAWLQENIPALYVCYTTVMRYKAMAKKLMQVTGLSDPVPAAAVLGEPIQENDCKEDADGRDGILRNEKQYYGWYEIKCHGRDHNLDGTMDIQETADAQEMTNKEDVQGEADALRRKIAHPYTRMHGRVPELVVVRARAVWLEVVDGVRGSVTALMERLDALTDPERVEDAAMLAGWKAKYENEITERMRSKWWRRMVRKRNIG